VRGSVLMFSAADWKLDEPDWTGRLKVVTKGSDLVLKLEDVNTGMHTVMTSTQVRTLMYILGLC